MIEMKGTILLNYSENTHQVEDEEKARFLRGLLEQMFEEIPEIMTKISEIWSNDSVLSPEQKIKMRIFMDTYDIQVIDDLDGHMKIYLDNQVIGEWFKCRYKLKRDLSQINRRKQLYLEMEVNCWTIFESTQETQES